MREIKDTENRRPLPDAEADGIIEGRNAVIEALRTETAIDKIYIAKGETDKTLGHIASKARAAGIVVVDADRRKLDAMSRTHAHQGVIALAAVREYATVEQREYVYQIKFKDKSGNEVASTKVVDFYLIDTETLEITDEKTNDWH